METSDKVTDLVRSQNQVATQLKSTLVERGLKMVESEEPSEKTFQESCYDFLIKEGYRPRVADRFILFKHEGVTYNLYCFTSAKVFEVYTSERYEMSSLDRFDILEIANESNEAFVDAKVTVVKAELDDDCTIVSFASQCHYPDSFEETFSDKMAAVRRLKQRFAQKVLEWNA
jgi:hypothetical protein